MHNIYEQPSMNKLLLTFSIPAILSLMVEISTSVVDTAFAGNIGANSADALTAMGILSPLLAIFTALQTLFAVSTAIMIAKHLNNRYIRDQYFMVGFLLSALIAVVTSVIFFLWLTPILSFLGAEGNVLLLAEQYLTIQLMSNIFSAVGYTLTGCIRAFGHPKKEFFIIGLSVFFNIALNTFFTFGLSLGIVGIALGTLTSEILCASIAFFWLRRNQLFFNPTAITGSEGAKISYQMFKIGIAQTLIQALAGATGFFINAKLLTFGSPSYIATWNVVQKIYTLILMPIVGLSQGAQTILAYFGCNGSAEKIKQTTGLAMIYCGIYGVTATVMTLFYGDGIVALFGLTDTLLTQASAIIAVIFVTFPLSGILFISMTLLQVTERELASVVLILTRQVFSVIPLVVILPLVFSHIDTTISPVMSIFFAIPIADMFSIAVAIFLVRKKQHTQIDLKTNR